MPFIPKGPGENFAAFTKELGEAYFYGTLLKQHPESQKDWKSRLRRERYNVFTNFRSGTPRRRQVPLENCVYSGQGGGMIYIERDWTQGQYYKENV